MGGNQSTRGAGAAPAPGPTPGHPNRGSDVVRAIDAMWLEAAAAAARATPPGYDMDYHRPHHHHHHHRGCYSAVRYISEVISEVFSDTVWSIFSILKVAF